MALLNERQAAERLSLSHRTLQRWRVSGGGPRFRKLGAAVRYDERDLDAFAEAGSRQSTSDTGRAAA
jgi:predicted DNA-binding transcriptional regulator AlpA